MNIDKLRVATPCPMNWEQMRGDDRTRFCDLCQLRVYNISGLKREEVQRLIATTDGRICARLYRRADGTVLTRDCVVGVRALRRRVARRTGALFAALISLAVTIFGQQSAKQAKAGCKPQITVQRTLAKTSKKSFTGVVADINGAAVPFSKVTLTNLDSHEMLTAETNDEGVFAFDLVAPADYSVRVEASGFKAVAIKRLNIRENETADVHVMLQPSGETEMVGILAADDLIDRPTNTTILDERLLRQLPIHK